MPMRQDCKNFESRSYPNGDTVRKCNLDLAPEAPWRCPEDCQSFAKRRVDVNWSHGTLITPETPDEPASLGEDGSIAAAAFELGTARLGCPDLLRFAEPAEPAHQIAPKPMGSRNIILK